MIVQQRLLEIRTIKIIRRLAAGLRLQLPLAHQDRACASACLPAPPPPPLPLSYICDTKARLPLPNSLLSASLSLSLSLPPSLALSPSLPRSRSLAISLSLFLSCARFGTTWPLECN